MAELERGATALRFLHQRTQSSFVHFGALVLATVLAGEGRGDEIEKHLARAQAFEKEKDYGRAAVEYEQVLKANPRLAVVRQSLGITHHLRADYERAIAEFKRALATDPSLWGSHLFLGIAYYKTNQFAGAVPALLKSIQLNAPLAEGEARFWLGVSYAALGRTAEAGTALKRAEGLRPNDVEVLYQLALVQKQAAAEAFEKIGRLDPGGPYASLLQAERYIADGRRELAAVEYRRARAVRPDWKGHIAELEEGIESTPRRARPRTAKDRTLDSLLEQGKARLQEAAATLDRMVAADPDSFRVHQLQAERHEERTEFEKAIEAHQAALTRNADAAGSRYAIGNIYFKQRDLENAEYWLGQELGRNPHHGLANARLGSVYLERGDHERAVTHLQRALQAGAEAGVVLVDLGRAYLAAGKTLDAVTTLRRAAAVEPANDRIQFLLAGAYQKAGRAAEAEAALAKYRELSRKRLEGTRREVETVTGAAERK